VLRPDRLVDWARDEF